MGVSGCPRSCVESGVKDFGIISVENGFQIYIGGNGGTEVEKAEFLTTVETEDEVIKLCGALMQYYRETGIYAERTAPWLRRLGFENVKEVLLDPERQNELFERIMDAKKQSKLNLGKQSLVMRKLEKSLKWRRCNTWKRKENQSDNFR